MKQGMRVIITRLGPTHGMMVKGVHLECRRAGATGVLGNWIPGHGGDVWWVAQDDGSVGAYATDEFEETSIEPEILTREKLVEHLEKLTSLLRDPQPGLSSWNEMYNSRMAEILKYKNFRNPA